MACLLVGIQALPPIAALQAGALGSVSPTPTTLADELPIRFAPGADLATAQRIGFAGAFHVGHDGASFQVALRGPASARVTIDNLTHLHRAHDVLSYNIQVAARPPVGGFESGVLRARFYEGTVPPAGDADPQVCAVLDLNAPTNIETRTSCSARDVALQVILETPAGWTAPTGGTFGLRPSSVTRG